MRHNNLHKKIKRRHNSTYIPVQVLRFGLSLKLNKTILNLAKLIFSNSLHRYVAENRYSQFLPLWKKQIITLS